jgi:hypothetical protein
MLWTLPAHPAVWHNVRLKNTRGYRAFLGCKDNETGSRRLAMRFVAAMASAFSIVPAATPQT